MVDTTERKERKVERKERKKRKGEREREKKTEGEKGEKDGVPDPDTRLGRDN